VVFSSSLDGVAFEDIVLIDFAGFGMKNENQEIITVSSGSLEGTQARFVRMKAQNMGSCPDWHAAATELSWLFCDELVVRGK
jgi:hypothetical protein